MNKNIKTNKNISTVFCKKNVKPQVVHFVNIIALSIVYVYIIVLYCYLRYFCLGTIYVMIRIFVMRLCCCPFP